MKAKDIMTSRVVTVTPDETVSRIAALLIERHISAVPVVDADGTLRGIVSEGDLLRRAEIGTEKPHGSWWLSLWSDPSNLADAYSKAHGQHARDIMTANVITVGEDTPIAEIAETLERNHIKRVPVIKDGKLVGIVSRANIVQKIAAERTAKFEASTDDAAIRERIDHHLRDQPWASIGTSNVTVTGGVVEFWGTIGSEEERRATRVLAEEVSGVKEVRDHRVVRPYIAGDGL